MNKRLLLWFCLFICSTTSIFGNDWSSQITEANILQNSGEYQKAVELYETILDADHYSAELHYNLGLCYYHSKKIGKAILHFERALVLDPKMRIASENIATIRSEQLNAIFQLEPFFISKYWKKFSNVFSVDAWAILVLLLLLVSLYLTYLLLLGQSKYSDKWIKSGLITGLIICLLIFLAGNTRYNVLLNNDQAIVLEDMGRFLGPSEKSAVDEQIVPEGTKVILLEELTGWYKVSLPDLDQVWLHEDMFERI